MKTFGRAGGKGVQTKKTTETKRIITEKEKIAARDAVYQFVLTLEIQEDNENEL